MDDDRQGWHHVRSEDGPDYHIFRVRFETVVSSRTGAEGRYVVLDCPDWVNVIAVTDEGMLVLVRQYRHGIDAVSLEIPAGTVERGEEPLQTARRELAEETGYEGGRWRLLGRVRPNAAFQNNYCYNFLAEGVRATATMRLDPGEAIDVELHPLQAIPDLIAQGAINQAMMISAFYWFDQHRS